MWQDILKVEKLNWERFKASIPEGANIDTLNIGRTRRPDLLVQFQTTNQQLDWIREHGNVFNITLRDIRPNDTLLIPRINFDKYDDRTRLKVQVEDEKFKFQDFQNP